MPYPDQRDSTVGTSIDPTSRDLLDRSLAAGLAWSGLAKWGAQLLSWASTLVVVRLLTPTDYGIMGMATVYLGFIQLVSEFGLGAALIQRRDLQGDEVARLGGLAVLIGIGLFTVSAALASPISAFFGEPRVRGVVLVLAGMFVVTGLKVVPSSLLARDLAFRRLAIIESAEAVTQVVVTLSLALAGARYWSLVGGGVCAKTLGTALLLRARPHALAWPRNLRAMSGAITFGWRVVVSRVSWYLYSNADFAIIGRVLGTAPLGTYSVGWNLASIPVDKVTAVLGRVALPVLSQVQSDRAAVARYLMLLSEGLALIVLPASLGLALVAPDFVPVVLGPRWVAAVLPLQLLSVHVTVRCLASLFAQALLAIDETKQSVRLGIAQVVVLPTLFYVAARGGGVDAVALAWLVAHTALTIPMLFRYTLRRVDASLARLARSLWPALSSAMLMAGAVVGGQAILRDDSAILRLAACVSAGVAAYAATLLLVHRGRLKHLLQAARRLRA